MDGKEGEHFLPQNLTSLLLSSWTHSSPGSKGNLIRMGDKPKDEKETNSTSTTELATANLNEVARDFIKTKIDTFDNYMDELFCQGVEPNGKLAVGSVSSPARNFASVDTVSRTPCSSNDRAIWQDPAVSPNPEIAGYHPEHGQDVGCLSWLSSRKVRQTTASMCLDKEPKPTLEKSLIGETSSAIDFGKYVKVKETSAFGMQPQPSDFSFTANMVQFNTSNGTERAQQIGLPKDFSAHYNLPSNEQFFDQTSSQFVGSLSPVPQIKADPGSLPSLTGDGMANIDVTDYAQPSPQTLAMLKHEPCRVPVSATGADPALWCQQGFSEDQHQDPTSLSPCGTSTTPTAYNAYVGVLPQRLCYICGDEASGCHYGVLTCGSCKVFFKRAVEGHQKYLCAGRNDCIVDKIRRKNCPACRLRKCYQAGMMLGGRKLKKFGPLKAVGLSEALAVQSPAGRSCDGEALPSFSGVPAMRELRFYPQIISVLENIEPQVVYAGYDNTQPDLPHILLNSLNRLCERQLLWIVRWSKSLPGFRNLHINDQMSLIQYNWMGLMLFALGWRSFQNVSKEYLYFAPDLVLHEDRMKHSPISHLCLAMQFIPREFANLQVTKEEFLCMKALMFLSTVPLEGLKSQEQFDAMRQNYIHELTRAIHLKEKGMVGSSQRFYHLTKLMDAMHEIAKKVNLYCLSTFMQADAMRVEFPEMMSEVVATHLPKMLAGMVKPLLFHTK